MRLTKKLEAEIKDVMNDYWNSYFEGRLDHWGNYLVENYRNIGGTEEEIWNSKTEILDYTKRVIDQMHGATELRNKQTQIIPYDPYIMVHELLDIFIKIEDEWTFYQKFRLSSLIQKTIDGWKVLHQHGSYPDSKTTEGEAFAFDTLKSENTKLQKAISERTVELEHKNRELEIEAATERVRVQAMAMQHPNDLEKVNKELLHQLTKLKIDGLTGVSFYFVDEDEIVTVWDLSSPGSMNDPNSYSFKYDSKKHPVLGGFVKILRTTQEDYFILDFPKSSLLEGVEELKEINITIYKAIKTAIETGALSHQWNPAARITDGILSIDLVKPPDDDTKIILLKMAGAFNQAYTRFLDLQKAESQVREAQIEAGLERVRSRSLAMHNTSELQEVIHTVHKELLNLNIAINGGSFIAINSDIQSTLRCWGSGGTADTSEEVHLPLYEKPFCTNLINGIKNGPAFFTEDFTKKEKKEFFTFLFKHEPWSKLDAKQKKETLLSKGGYTRSCCVSKHTSIFIINHFGERFSQDDNDILQRFGRVFEQTYTRFLDLQKAEAQAREAQIEAALERVRSKTMAMHNSQDVSTTVRSMFEELLKLGVDKTIRCGIGILKDTTELELWTAYWGEDDNVSLTLGRVDTSTHPLLSGAANAWKNKKSTFTYELAGEDLVNYYTVLNNAPHYPFHIDIATLPPKLIHYAFYFPDGTVFAFAREPLPDELMQIFKRFAAVFGQTYRRYLDLLKAEANAREAQIEASLERVRSRTMGMQHSDHLKDVIGIIGNQLHELGLHYDFVNFIIGDASEGFDTWNVSFGQAEPVRFFIPLFDNRVFKETLKAREDRLEFNVYTLTEDETRQFIKHLITNTILKYLPEEQLRKRLQSKGMSVSTALLNEVYLTMGNYSSIPYTDEENSILKRFGFAFQQAFTRFLDLQKAEAQAREAKVEAALEKVRSRSLAMHNSTEIEMVLEELLARIKDLEVDFDVIGILQLNNNSFDRWSGYEKGTVTVTTLPYFREGIPYFTDVFEAMKNGTELFAHSYSFKEKNEYFNFLFAETNFKEFVSQDRKEFLLQVPILTVSIGFAKDIAIQFQSYYRDAFSDAENDILKRFVKVFEQAYTRFLDLQRAEALTRESQIELGLERVRARAMAMQNSHELKELIGTVFIELTKLDLVLTRCVIMIYDPKTNGSTWWMANSEAPSDPIGLHVNYHEYPPYLAYIKAWQQKNLKWQYVLEDTDKKEWDDYLFVKTELSQLPDFVIAGMKAPDRVYLNASFNSFGNLTLATLEILSNEHFDILLRFAKVFDLTYTRFNDLKQAEFQARQAKIETALEKVRARALAMQLPEELIEVAEVLRHEMGLLGVEELETCSIFIHDETINRTECWYALKDIRSEEKKLVSDHFPLSLHDTWVGREMENFYGTNVKQVSIVMQGAHRKEWINYCEEKSIPFRGYYGEVIPDRTYHLYKFSHGAIGAASAGDISAESWDLLQRAASVFSLAYSRFKDLTQARIDLHKLKEEKQRAETALSELQTTQKQLIQSEKMASLGELTAGIAHEIQNPLNFVNNFSEVSNELLNEMMEEVAKGNYEEVKAIADDVKQNLEKINHHGKRADDIVKGMLQHSRSSSATKEPTDINKLADEYLRLAYHGLRAKDKSFNATMRTDFDESIGNVNIIPQDIGRVILNLITNAFYVVNEKSKKSITGYEPTVTIATSSIQPPSGGRSIQIKVSDNGGGIPQKVLDKIFQPFFTTKPTGQGTGLGLSLAYDIVKAHGGELTVKTRDAEGLNPGEAATTFIISLPTNIT